MRTSTRAWWTRATGGISWCRRKGGWLAAICRSSGTAWCVTPKAAPGHQALGKGSHSSHIRFVSLKVPTDTERPGSKEETQWASFKESRKWRKALSIGSSSSRCRVGRKHHRLCDLPLSIAGWRRLDLPSSGTQDGFQNACLKLNPARPRLKRG